MWKIFRDNFFLLPEKKYFLDQLLEKAPGAKHLAGIVGPWFVFMFFNIYPKGQVS